MSVAIPAGTVTQDELVAFLTRGTDDQILLWAKLNNIEVVSPPVGTR